MVRLCQIAMGGNHLELDSIGANAHNRAGCNQPQHLGMRRSASAIRWLFTPPPTPTPGRAILWWELRRIPVNLLIGLYGILCLLIFFAAIHHAHLLQPGEDAIEPIAIVLAPIAFNLCYTLGWLVEAPARVLAPRLTPKLGPRLLLIGLAFSLLVISLPAVFWLGYACVQAMGLLK